MNTLRSFQFGLASRFRNMTRSTAWIVLCLAACLLGLGVSAAAREGRGDSLDKARIITFDAPDAGTEAGQGTLGLGLNDLGAVAGYYGDSGGKVHGFVRDPFGKITEFDAPDAVCGTVPLNPNNAGAIDGFYFDSNCIPHGFVRDRFGKFIEFDAPGAIATVPAWMNSRGEIAGYWFDSCGCMSHGFVRAADGTITEFDPPGSIGMTTLQINSWGGVTG
jgi:hypothetical protein